VESKATRANDKAIAFGLAWVHIVGRSDMHRTLLILVSLFPLLTAAQELPYAPVLSLQQAAEFVAGVQGISCKLRFETRDGVRRPFRIVVESPSGRMPVKVDEDGAFELPHVPRGDRPASRLVHNLEKGALSLTVDFRLEASILRPEGSQQTDIFTICSEIAERFRRSDGIREALGQLQPELNDLQVAIVGLSCPRSEPGQGRVLLKQGSTTVVALDLAQTGRKTFLFEDYDPRQHAIVWDTPVAGSKPPVEFVFASGAQAIQMKNSIFLWKAEPIGPADVE
jgi:hypothetical protein